MRVRLQASIGATIFGAFVVMGLLTAAVGGYGLYVLESAGGFVVNLYDRPLMALNFDRAASLGFASDAFTSSGKIGVPSCRASSSSARRGYMPGSCVRMPA